MGFRFRLASFLVAALVTVQVLTAGLVYSVTRHQLIDEGKRQLGISASAFGRQLGSARQDGERVLAGPDAVLQLRPGAPVIRPADERGPARGRVRRVAAQALSERREREAARPSL